ncbi:kinase-like domain-containing protein [Rhizophagus irregularis DAOM 181602=DAOM 197198]|nr:kinase-like domain-containing protein [Rhizophagus irregularis DAOM 181602=DAOM 197198]
MGNEVILKVLDNSNDKFLDEWKYHYNYLMKKCWDEDPSNRPTVRMLENIISQWIDCVNEYYRINDDENNIIIPNIDDQQLKNDMLEYVKANKANG